MSVPIPALARSAAESPLRQALAHRDRIGKRTALARTTAGERRRQTTCAADRIARGLLSKVHVFFLLTDVDC